MKSRLLVACCVGLCAMVGSGCGGSRTAGAGVGPPQLDPDLSRVSSPGPDDQACSEDLDCALVQDCCGCRAGGRLLGVRRDRVETLQGAAEGGCAEQCSATSSRHRSCSASEAICRGGRCIPALNQ